MVDCCYSLVVESRTTLSPEDQTTNYNHAWEDFKRWDNSIKTANTVPVFIAIVDLIPVDSTQLFAITAQALRIEHEFTSAAEAQLLHHSIDITLKYLSQLQKQLKRLSNY